MSEIPQRVVIPPRTVVGEDAYCRLCWDYLRSTIRALPIELSTDDSLKAVCRGAFPMLVDGETVVYDYSDYLLIHGEQRNYRHWLRFHHTAGFHPHANIGSFPPISFVDWAEYERFSRELRYDASGEAIVHTQSFEFLARSVSPRDRDLYRRRKRVRDLLTAAYGERVLTERRPQQEFWRLASGSLVSVHVPGSWRHSLDRGQHQLLGLGVCTVSPEIWTATLDQRIESGLQYLRVRDDFSDLIDVIDWCRHHRDQCTRIGQRAKEFFQQHSTPLAIWSSIHSRRRQECWR